MQRLLSYLLIVATALIGHSSGYSALEDARIIAEYRRQLQADKNHAKIVRSLVHQADWASVGTISTNSKILGFPMVNIIAIDDSSKDGKSTGKIHFLLTDLDFTGPDWRVNNKVTFLFTDDQNKNCAKKGLDPMEPTCPRTIISGKVIEIRDDNKNYADIQAAFIKRHPAAKKWIEAHTFYMCELDIQNIYVLDGYGGPHDVKIEDYYNADPENVVE